MEQKAILLEAQIQKIDKLDQEIAAVTALYWGARSIAEADQLQQEIEELHEQITYLEWWGEEIFQWPVM